MDSDSDALRIAHVPINVTVLDVNDNAPMFVNLPYYAIVSIDAKKDDLITKVKHKNVLKNICTIETRMLLFYNQTMEIRCTLWIWTKVKMLPCDMNSPKDPANCSECPGVLVRYFCGTISKVKTTAA